MSDGVEPRRGVEVGLLKLSLTEPWAGRAADYFEWYDRDHAYSANLAGPGVFAGRLWHASANCTDLRFAAPDSALASLKGQFLSTFFVLAGDVAAWSRWSNERYAELTAQGRSFSARTTLLAQLFEPTWTVARDAPGVPLHCALDHPFRGVAMVVVERRDAADGPDPAVVAPRRPEPSSGAVALAAGFSPRSIGGWASPAALASPGHHAVELWFFDTGPSAAWLDAGRAYDEALQRSGAGRVVCFAPFEPTIPGGAAGG